MTKITGTQPELFAAELSLEVARKRTDPDAFDRLSVAVEDVELATALGIAEMLPVRGLVAGAGKARLLDEGFEHDRPIGVASLPVGGQPATHQGEDARGQVFAVDPRQDEEASIIDDQMQIALSLICRPADELIARLYFPGTRAEAEHGDDVAGGAHEVAQLRAVAIGVSTGGPAALIEILRGLPHGFPLPILLAIRRADGRTIAQDEATSVVFGMPREAILLGAAEQVLPLEKIAPALGALANGAAAGRQI